MFKCYITKNLNFKVIYFVWLLYYGLYCISFYLFDKAEGRTLAIRSAVTWKAVRTNFFCNSLKELKKHRSQELLEASWASCYSFCKFVKIVTMFLNFNRCSRENFWSTVFGIGPCACKEICKFICSFNLPKVMKTC